MRRIAFFLCCALVVGGCGGSHGNGAGGVPPTNMPTPATSAPSPETTSTTVWSCGVTIIQSGASGGPGNNGTCGLGTPPPGGIVCQVSEPNASTQSALTTGWCLPQQTSTQTGTNPAASPTASPSGGLPPFISVITSSGHGAGNQGKFSSICFYTHSLQDDPIVHPDDPGASHMHDFIGNPSTDAFSTIDTIFAAPTNCVNSLDHAAYWVPQLSVNGTVFHPSSVTVYYLSNQKNNVQVYPFGLRIVAGDAKAVAPSAANHYAWGCSTEFPSGLTDTACSAGQETHARINFPDCWNGADLDSVDHKSHMAYSSAGVCPPGYPVPVPELSLLVKYQTLGGSGLTLSSGPSYTMHADFLNAWTPSELQMLVTACNDANADCQSNHSETPSPLGTFTSPPVSM